MNGRGAQGRKRGRDTSRDGGRFVALPLSVLECPAYAALSHPARSLLLEVAMQCHGDDNGRLLLSRAHLAKRGWRSADVIQRAKQELLDGGFIFETVKGCRPNKASWYAVTWRSLDKLPGYDQGVTVAFQRGAYRLADATKNTPLIPSHGTGAPAIGPPHGTGGRSSVPSHGPMAPVSTPRPVPSHGHPLEVPSVVVEQGRNKAARATPERAKEIQ